MFGDESIYAVAREWTAKADNDLANAVQALRLKKRCPTDTVCFHAQQCVEKYLKGLLILRGIAFPKTHNIEELLFLVPAELRPDLEPQEQARLTAYATVTRYPGDYEPIPLAEARRAVQTARPVRQEIRQVLSKAA